MKIKILTLFPEMYNDFLNTSMIKRILATNLADVEIINIRNYSFDKHKHVDDTPYGGGAGMLMRVDIAHRALSNNSNLNTRKILMSPKGKRFNQELAKELAKEEEILLFCGHYEGIDSRIEKYFDDQISIGDFILTGGELPSMIIIDSILRLLKDGISPDSLKEESFNNDLLEYPQYTRPLSYLDDEVPEVLTSGHHENIRRYNLKMSLLETIKYRPDLLKDKIFNKEEKELLEEIIKEYQNLK